jgi:hypothetical protein
VGVQISPHSETVLVLVKLSCPKASASRFKLLSQTRRPLTTVLQVSLMYEAWGEKVSFFLIAVSEHMEATQPLSQVNVETTTLQNPYHGIYK